MLVPGVYDKVCATATPITIYHVGRTHAVPQLPRALLGANFRKSCDCKPKRRRARFNNEKKEKVPERDGGVSSGHEVTCPKLTPCVRLRPRRASFRRMLRGYSLSFAWKPSRGINPSHGRP